MLFKVRPGAGDRSFGIAVAELAGFPAEIVTDARAIADRPASVASCMAALPAATPSAMERLSSVPAGGPTGGLTGDIQREFLESVGRLVGREGGDGGDGGEGGDGGSSVGDRLQTLYEEMEARMRGAGQA